MAHGFLKLLKSTLLGLAALASTAQAGETIVLASTTSTEQSGLFHFILPIFEKDSGIAVKVVALGTGQALDVGRRGDADVLLVHDRAAEDKFVAEGYGVDRRDVMYNDFVLVGPAGDPAQIRGRSDVLDAFRQIAAKRARFVSRGDDSGTERMELRYWQQLGIAAKGAPWHVSAGLGMGEVLTMAGEMQAYTLADRATYASYRSRTGLEILVQGDQRMFNPYGIIAVNPAKYPERNFAGATALIDWLTSAAGRAAIRSFRPDGEQLFFVTADR